MQRLLKIFIKKFLFNADLSYLSYFIFVLSFGLSGKDALLIYAFFSPWLILILLFPNMPFLRILFSGVDMTEGEKINHVLEHGTVYFMKQKYGKKYKIGGRALDNGFRINGVKDKEDIKESFDMLRGYLNKENSAFILSKFCGSNVPVLQGISLIMLTMTLMLFFMKDLGLLQVEIILLINLILYIFLRYPIGKYFQKKWTMSFDFSDAQIIEIEKAEKDYLIERDSVYVVRTKIIGA